MRTKPRSVPKQTTDKVGTLAKRSTLIALWILILSAGVSLPAKADVVTVDGISVSDLFPMSHDKASEAALARAIESFGRNDLAQCKVQLDAARSINDDLPQVDVILSRMYLARGNYRAALALLENIVLDSPADPDVYQCFGEIALATGRNTDAWLQFEHAKRVGKTAAISDSRREFLMLQLLRLSGITAEKRQDFATAEQLYRELLDASPNDVQAKWKLGQVIVAQGDAEGGFEILQREHQFENSLPQPELTVATILVARNQNDKAEPWFQKSVEAETATERNRLAYAKWLLDRDRLEQAAKLLSQTPDKWQSNRDIVFTNAVIARCLGDLEAAESGFLSILRDNGNDLEASDQLALVLVESDKPEKQDQAKQISESNLGRTPNLQRSVATAAWVKFKLGSVESAEPMFRALHQSGTISPQSASYIGQLLESKGQEKEARSFYRRALSSRGFFPHRRVLQDKLNADTP